MTRSKTTVLSIFLLSMAVLLIELCLTRVFSVLSWHHFAYLIISLALLGFGAAGSYLTVAKRFADKEINPARLGHFAWMFALTTACSIVLISKIRFYPVDIVMRGDYSNGLSLVLLYLAAGIPFFFAGVCIGRLVALAGDRINQIYFADLCGAGAGALGALFVLNTIGAVPGIFLATSVVALVACMLGTGGVRWRRWAYGLTLLLAVVMVPATLYTRILPLYYPPSKGMYRAENKVVYSKSHVVGKIDVLKPVRSAWSFGGALSNRYEGESPMVQGIFQDGAAPAGIMYVDGRAEDTEILGEYLQGLAYTVKRPERVLIIGVGGGIDALIALHHGAGKVTGVDINPVTIDAMSNRYRDKSPALWREGRFEPHVAEGRHYLTRCGERFDVIQLSGVDTFTALSSGAYALSENFLYTQEAMDEYFEHLTEDGILSFSRWLFEPPRETLRLVVTQLAMLDEKDVTKPADHFVIIYGPAYKKRSPWAETLLKRTPFTPAEVDALTTWAEDRKFTVLYDPFHRRDNEFDRFLQAAPAERKALIDAYAFNVQPTTDDDPFFFHFYRWKSLLALVGGKGGLSGSKGGYGITRVPLGLIILVISLVQIIVLSLVFIIAPLKMRARLRTHGRGRLGLFTYFAALGLGFIVVEIALLQKLSIFVGGPVYSMGITLASILLFSGVGSFIARRFRHNPQRWIGRIVVAIIACTALEILFLNYALPHLMGLGLYVRWGVAAACMLPIGLLMGMPFPTGMRLVERMDESVRPWAWGINSCATVLGSMFCILLSIQTGFTIALITACGIYALGAVGMSHAVNRNRPG
ncbi:MAG: 50S ribosomal protein L11 methyltransferase [Phycisphaerae bacterium]|jgi:spermidine synthase|nr:50S ribosomal protein L11 methyltransferase [Phycisphaerae bacterium]